MVALKVSLTGVVLMPDEPVESDYGEFLIFLIVNEVKSLALKHVCIIILCLFFNLADSILGGETRVPLAQRLDSNKLVLGARQW